MRRCFLHIGPHKTGSSSIQRFVLDNRNTLGEAGFYVPRPERETPKGNHTHLIADHASGCSPQETALARELKEYGQPRNIIISSERYAPLFTDPDFLDWAQFYFANLGYSLTVVAYIRPQVALLNSHYTQRAKHLRLLHSFKRHLKQWSSGTDTWSYLRRFAPLLAAEPTCRMFIPFYFGNNAGRAV